MYESMHVPGDVTATASWRARLTVWSTAVGEGFIALLPLTLLGAVAKMVGVFAGWQQGQVSDRAWTTSLIGGCDQVYAATMGIMGFASAATIAGRACLLLRDERGEASPPPIGVAILAGSAFLLSGTSADVASGLALGYGQVLEGILIGLVTAEISCAVAKQLPQQVGLAAIKTRSLLQQSLRLCWAAAAVLGLVCGLKLMVQSVPPVEVDGWWNLVPVQAEDLGPVLLNGLVLVVNQVAWLCGVNGGQLIHEWGERGLLLMASNQVVWAEQLASPTFMNGFAQLGGAGGTWGLILAALWRARDPAIRRIAQLSVAPAMVNVNEVLLFGLPIVFSRTLWLPFVLVPLVNCCIAGWLVDNHLLRLNSEVPVAWSTPVIVSGVALTGSAWGGVLQLALVVLDAVIYWPFLRRLEHLRSERADRVLRDSLDILMDQPSGVQRLLYRPDAVGDVARRLMEDFSADLSRGRVGLAYQPQHAVSGEVVGVEALLRWEHDRHGAIPAAAVVNVAEECEVIHALGAWVVEHACQDLATLRSHGYGTLLMSINMSPLQLESPHWAEQVSQALARHQLPSGLLDVEITEGRMLSTTSQSEATLSRLQAIGVGLSMDDFGMGCTSLLYMQRFRMHAIKLDAALTRDVLHNEVSQHIIRSVASLGHAQGVQVIAEFVETADQRDLLHRLGCDSCQGWLYSKALPLPQLLAYLARQQRARRAMVAALANPMMPIVAT